MRGATVVNVELLKFYWSLGADIVRMEKGQPWGNGFMARLSRDLQNLMPKSKCFSTIQILKALLDTPLLTRDGKLNHKCEVIGVTVSKQLATV